MVCGVHIDPRGDDHQKLDKGCKKQKFVEEQEVWLDRTRPRFLPKELRFFDSSPLKVLQALLGGVVEVDHLIK